MIMSKLEEAISALSACEDWDELQAEWKKRWAKTLHYYAVFSGWDVKVGEIDLFMKVQPQNDWQAKGLNLRNRMFLHCRKSSFLVATQLLLSWLSGSFR